MSDATQIPTLDEIYQAKKDVKDINTFATSTDPTFVDSKGRGRKTVDGVITQAEADFAAAIAGTGWFAAPDSFEVGGTIAHRNQYLQLTATVGGDNAGGYTWGGPLPKIVPPGSTPATTGGQSPSAWVWRSDTTVRSDLANGTADIGGVPSSRLSKTVIQIDGIKSLPVSGVANGQQFSVAGFYAGSAVGGGTMVWDSTRNKSDHNGGTVIAPDAINAWNGTHAGLSTLLNWTGSGTGCYVKKNSYRPNQYDFGAVDGANSSTIVDHMIRLVKNFKLTNKCHFADEVTIETTGVKIDAKDCEITNSLNKVFTLNANNFKMTGGVFDAEDKNVVTMFDILKDVQKPVLKGLTFKNFNSTTFVRALQFSEENVTGFKFYDIHGENLYALPDNIVGNDNGSCRLIYMKPGLASELVTPSSGIIKDITGKDVLTQEDADLVHLISNSDTKNFNIKVQNIHGVNIGKRVVKVQARGVKVKNVYADASNNEWPMWSAVSLYKGDCSAIGVEVIGSSRTICDSEGDDNILRILEGNFFGLRDIYNLGLLSMGFKVAKGSCEVTDVKVKNAWNIGRIFPENGNISKVNIRGVQGVTERESFLIRCLTTGNDIGEVTVDGFDITTTQAYRNFWCLKESGNIGAVSIKNGEMNNENYYNNLGAEGISDVQIKDIKVNGSGVYDVALSLVSCGVGIKDIQTTTAGVAVKLTDCDNTLVQGVKGATIHGVYLVRGTNHIVGDVFCAGAPTTPVRLGATTDTPVNVRQFNIINMV